MIGTPLWRTLNYGVKPTLKYFTSRRLGSKSTNKNLEVMSLNSFAELIGVKGANPEIDSRERVISLVRQMQAKMELESDGRTIKNVLGSDSSIARLIILELAIRSARFTSFLETGTQHGLSAFVVNESAKMFSLEMNVVSFDVSTDQYIVKSAGVTYSALSWPVRRNFKKETLNLKRDPLLFFHDSDHSYENMFFEFQWAWNQLQAEVIISDDIDGNDAFYDFCTSSGIPGYRIMIDNGPAIGFAMRGI